MKIIEDYKWLEAFCAIWERSTDSEQLLENLIDVFEAWGKENPEYELLSADEMLHDLREDYRYAFEFDRYDNSEDFEKLKKLIQSKIDGSKIEDTSWHNDVCPSFRIDVGRPDYSYKVFLAFRDPADREFPEQFSFGRADAEDMYLEWDGEFSGTDKDIPIEKVAEKIVKAIVKAESKS